MEPLSLKQTNQPEDDSKTVFGFWVYIMTDCILFASLFAAFAVLHNNTYGGPGARDLFSLSFVLTETLILLTSSFSAGMVILAAHRGNKSQVIGWLCLTFLLGAAFLSLEINEFSHLVSEGNSWRRSGFLSAFFTLVGTHGLHITAGLLWMAFLIPRILKRGINSVDLRRLTCLTLFWHFLDIVWIFIFTIVYLMGLIS